MNGNMNAIKSFYYRVSNGLTHRKKALITNPLKIAVAMKSGNN